MVYNAKKHNYTNKDIDYIVSSNIREYDIKSAGFNMLISADALSDKKKEYLSSLDKEKRNITIGLMQKNNKEITKIINSRLEYYRKEFIQSNDILDYNIISVKKDAIFTVNAIIKKTKFDNVIFDCKNKYSSYYNINGVEFFFSKMNNDLTIKGLGKMDSEDKKNLKKHNDYMINFLIELFKLNESSNRNACMYLRDFVYKYINKKLNINYYRELNGDSKFRLKDLKMGNSNYALDSISKDYLKYIDITYNYRNIIVPIIKMIY